MFPYKLYNFFLLSALLTLYYCTLGTSISLECTVSKIGVTNVQIQNEIEISNYLTRLYTLHDVQLTLFLKHIITSLQMFTYVNLYMYFFKIKIKLLSNFDLLFFKKVK